LAAVKVFLDNTRSALSLHHGVGNVGTHFFRALRRHAPEVDPVFLVRRGAEVTPEARSQLAAWGCAPLRRYHPRLSLHLALQARVLHSTYHKLPRLPFRTRIVHVHDVWTLRPNPYQSEGFQAGRAGKLRAVLERADLYTTLTRTVKDELVDALGVEPARVTVTGYGVPAALDPPAAAAAARPPAELAAGRPGEAPFVLSVARLEARKNFAHTARALEAVPGLRLVLVGGPGYDAARIRDETLAPLRKEGRLVHLERVSPAELAWLYRHAHAYLLPAWEEGFGITLLEALAEGLPVISADVSGCAEVVAGGGVLVDPHDWEASAHVLQRLLAEPDFRAELSRRARERAGAFRWEDVAQRLSALYAAS
jgi:alpha-1,3-rhamnosyl/mannosyltransferase